MWSGHPSSSCQNPRACQRFGSGKPNSKPAPIFPSMLRNNHPYMVIRCFTQSVSFMTRQATVAQASQAVRWGSHCRSWPTETPSNACDWAPCLAAPPPPGGKQKKREINEMEEIWENHLYNGKMIALITGIIFLWYLNLRVWSMKGLNYLYDLIWYQKPSVLGSWKSFWMDDKAEEILDLKMYWSHRSSQIRLVWIHWLWRKGAESFVFA